MNFRRAVDHRLFYIAATVMLVTLLALMAQAGAAEAGAVRQPGSNLSWAAYPPPANPPVATSDIYNTKEDTPLSIAAPGVLENDKDADGSSLSAVKVADPDHGIVVLSANGAFKYTPDPNWNGTDTFSYKASDGTLESTVVNVMITVDAANDAPIAVNDSYAADPNGMLNIGAPGILANDIDVDGDPIFVVLVLCPQHGNYILGVDGSLSYEAEPGFQGFDSLTYFATDNTLDSNHAIATIAVGVPSHPPVAKPDGVYTVDENGVLTIAPAAGVLANDTDAGGGPLNATRIAGPSRGALALNPDGSFTYTPTPGWYGDDSFTYQADDGNEYSNVATVTITVKPVDAPPVAVDDPYTTPQDTQLVVALPGVLGNDTDAENEHLTAAKVTDPGQGTLVFNANGSFTYNPGAGFAGTDTFTYKANDGKQDSNIATVTITVKAPNRPPVAVDDDSYTTDEDTPLAIPAKGVLTNDTDADGDPLTAVKVSDPAHGTLSLSPDGSFGYTPADNWNGKDSFTYKANDGLVDSNPATVTITVNPVNDAPVAKDNSYSTHFNTALNITSTDGVLSDDTNVDGDLLTAIQVSSTFHGSLALNADGSFTYTPNTGFSGDDTFQYKANDGSLDSNVATVTIRVYPPNVPPVANDDNYSVDEDTALDKTSVDGVLSNDTDADGNPLIAVKITDPVNGVLDLHADGSFIYTPNANWNGTDSFTYQAFDGIDPSGTATVTIKVNAVNDPPVAVDDIYAMTSRGKLIVAAPGVLSNDKDVEGDPLSAIKLSDPAHGTLTLNPDGSFAYAPNGGYRGSDTFTYKVNDGTADSKAATVTITGIDEIYMIYLPVVVKGNK